MGKSLHQLNVDVEAELGSASLIFVSTDVRGTPGALNRAVQDSLGFEFPLDPGELDSRGFQVVKSPQGPLIAWIVTVGGPGNTADRLRKNLAGALPEALGMLESSETGNRVWVPLMGTGTGRLRFEESAEVTFEVLAQELSRRRYANLVIDISLPPQIDRATLERIEEIGRSEIFENAWPKNADSESDDNARNVESGFQLRFQRETGEDLALDRNKFALSLARLFRIAEGEFSLALLGRWGAGKTKIASKISQYVKDETSYANDFHNFFGRPESEKNSRSYDVVKFNAWRYRRQPELWIWLYESFLQSYFTDRFDRRIIRSVRAGVEKQGFAATIAHLLLLAFLAFPFIWLTSALPYGLTVFGVSGLVGLTLLARRWQSSLRTLIDRYGLVASHSDKLGMQATIGEDLKILVKSWTKCSQFSRSQKLIFSAIFAVVTLLWGATLSAGESGAFAKLLQGVSTVILREGSPLLTEEVTFSVPILAFILWSLIVLLFLAAIGTDYARVDRILLIVDDLDRCPQEDIVDLIDGVKLMLDDEEVGSLVQALILADHTILEAAIRRRFSENGGGQHHSSQGLHEEWRPAVREHMEKVFLCHISIPVLNEDDIDPLIDVFAREFGSVHAKPHSTGGSNAEATSNATLNSRFLAGVGERALIEEAEFDGSSSGFKEGSASDLREGPAGTSSEKNADTEVSEAGYSKFSPEVVLSIDETEAIKSAINETLHNGEISVFTPRSIRALLFKYQLARMMLQANGIDIEPRRLASRLVEATFRDKGVSTKAHATRNGLDWVVELVS